MACEAESESKGNGGVGRYGDESESSDEEHGTKTPKLRGSAESLTGEANTGNETKNDDTYAGSTEDRHSGDENMYTAHSQDQSIDHAEEEDSENEHRGYEGSEGQYSDEEYPGRPRDEHSDHEHEYGGYSGNSHSDSDSDSDSSSA